MTKKILVIRSVCTLLLVILIAILPFLDSVKANFNLYKSPPQVTVSSPTTNTVYSQSIIPLNVQVKMNSHWIIAYEKLSWMKYLVDGQLEANLTVKDEKINSYGSFASGAATISDLSAGAHSVSIFGQTVLSDNSTNPLSDFRVDIYFIVVSVTPTILVLSPQSKTIDSTAVTLYFISDKSLSWTGYTLDNNMVVAAQTGSLIDKLSNGAHTLRIYGNDSTGKIHASQTTTFTINGKKPPIVTIDKEAIIQTRPKLPSDFQDKTWWMLIFEVNEQPSWMGYSLDRGATETIGGNTTLRLSYGSHTIIVYAKDNCGNMGSSSPYTFSLAPGEAGSAYASATPYQKPKATNFPSFTSTLEQPAHDIPDGLVIALVFILCLTSICGLTYIKRRKQKHDLI